MPTISASVVPTIAAGSLFSQLVKTDGNLNIRWLTAQDPVYFEATNRPMADITVRQLILAKAIDNLQVRLGHQNLFPFVVQPQVDFGSSRVDVPISLIWDLHVSLPKKWKDIRLAKVKRISGSNGGTAEEYTGMLRLIFTGAQETSINETSLFMADYVIDSTLSFQRQAVSVVTLSEEGNAIGTGESETIAGEVIFRTMDVTDETIQNFLDLVAPPTPGSEDSDGLFVSPAEYEIADNDAGGASAENDFDFAVYTHGTGILTSSATNSIPSLDSDASTWLNALNYPFRLTANRISATPIAVTLPKGLFQEFNLIAPDAERGSDNSTGSRFPVWLSKVVREDASADEITVYFSTFNVSASPSTVPIEFAKMTLLREAAEGDIVEITPNDDLFPVIDRDIDLALSQSFEQGFGKGHVRLSDKWGVSGGEVSDFFDSLVAVVGDQPEFTFSRSSTELSSYGLSRVPKTIPTVGESAAMSGSTSSLANPKYPSGSNRFVVEEDQGSGDLIDFNDPDNGLPSSLRGHPAFSQYGNTGALAHRIVSLVIDAAKGDIDYDRDTLPRLVILFGREPQFGDGWYDGTKFKWFNGDSWIAG